LQFFVKKDLSLFSFSQSPVTGRFHQSRLGTKPKLQLDKQNMVQRLMEAASGRPVAIEGQERVLLPQLSQFDPKLFGEMSRMSD